MLIVPPFKPKKGCGFRAGVAMLVFNYLNKRTDNKLDILKDFYSKPFMWIVTEFVKYEIRSSSKISAITDH